MQPGMQELVGGYLIHEVIEKGSHPNNKFYSDNLEIELDCKKRKGSNKKSHLSTKAIN